jgi:sugar phosphate isomerase/epimerase
MKLGISMWSYYRAWKNEGLDIPGFIRTVKELGADGVELLDFFWKDSDAEMPGVEDALAETGLPVGVYSVANNFVAADPIARQEQVGRITGGVDMARRFGAKVVRVFAGNAIEGVSFEDAFGWIVEGLSSAAAYAASHDVTLALENHGLLAGRSDQVKDLLAAVNNSALRANPDTGNFLLVHQAPHEAIGQLAAQAAMVHFKDFLQVPEDYAGSAYLSLDGLKFKGVALGDGDVALQDCVSELRSGGFNGWLNIEYEGEEDPATAMPRSVAYARKVMADGGR